MKNLRAFMFKQVYTNSASKKEDPKAQQLLINLYYHYMDHVDELPEEYALVRERDGTHRAVADYVAGMTDNYALELYHELYIPRGWAMTLRG